MSNPLQLRTVITLGVAGLLLASPLMAAAQAQTTTGSTQSILQVDGQGNALLRGTLQASSPNSLTVRSWGGDWTIRISSNTRVLPAGALSRFRAGDFVGVQGTVERNATLTIRASLVRDWTVNQGSQATLFVGTVTAKGPNSFTLRSNNTTYAVLLGTGAQILNVNRRPIPFSSIQVNDGVRVEGALIGSGNITASIVRDTSR